MSRISRKVKDKPVQKLSRSYLESGILVDAVVCPSTEGYSPRVTSLSYSIGGRIFIEVEDSPLYFVDQTCGFDQAVNE